MFDKKKSLSESQINFLRAFEVGRWIFTRNLTNTTVFLNRY